MTLSDLQRHELLSADDIAHKLRRIAAEIDEHAEADVPLAFIGIQTRGVPIAGRVAEILKAERPGLLAGTLDISLYRDDLDNLGTIPSIKGSDIPFDLGGAHVVLFDDVLFTGRTTRAAIDALMDYGRPKRVELAVLIDRGNRELPFAATYVGQVADTTRDEYVKVCLSETDAGEEEGAYLFRNP